jgi:hypothetical protein
MAVFKQIATAYPNAASDTSLTSVFTYSTEYQKYAILVPPVIANTATCGINVLGYDSVTNAYYDICYGNNPYSITCNTIMSIWQSPASAASVGMFVMCDALENTVGQAKLRFLRTMTANTSIRIFARVTN